MSTSVPCAYLVQVVLLPVALPQWNILGSLLRNLQLQRLRLEQLLRQFSVVRYLEILRERFGLLVEFANRAPVLIGWCVSRD